MVPSAYLDERIEGDKEYGASLWKPLDQECTKWLETKPQNSVVYISFGSMVSLTQQEMEEIAWGLHKSGFDFLWVVKDSERHKLPKGFLEFTTQNQEKGRVKVDDELGIVKREYVVISLNEVMNEGKRGLEIKKNVEKWRGLAKEAITEGGSSDKAIDEFVVALKTFATKK
ncbi:hypothetical protein L6452_17698 [Arctium lappa]|uniref:Uncharacterized protein n=1 Tax=Arctium lappa TaxID=4217 RepID=A0ACB9C440_ARCLA|nr:hypothetical protein L6452_17698 [Arctium lappa]